MKKSLRIINVLITILFLSACGKTEFDGSRTGNDSQFLMEYKVLNTTDSQDLTLESGEKIEAELVVDRGELSIIIQKGDQAPVYESEGIIDSDSFEVEIQEGGAYTISVTGENAKGSVSFVKIAAENENSEEVHQEVVDLSGAFQGIHGCAVIYSPSKEQYTFFNEELCRKEDSPYSTFKIISALSGLQNGILADRTSRMNYDGTVYGNPDWNGNLTLEEAFQKSCVWYFRQVIDAVGEEKMKEELTSLQYGNCDISEWGGSNINPAEELNGFWLGASLKISPLQQIKVLSKIFEGKSGYDNGNIEILKNIMLADESGGQKIYGKTGSGANGEAWFVGFSESGEEREYFAVYLNDSAQKEQVSGSKAKEIALEILK